MSHGKPDVDGPKPPMQPQADEVSENSGLDGWINSNNPHEGRFADKDSECAGDCPYCK